MHPVEQAARAILAVEHSYANADQEYGYNCAHEFVKGGEGGETKPQAWMWFEPHARAALAAVEQPSENMLFAADRLRLPLRLDQVRDLWRAMTGAALR